jgi:hypothetical protein
VSDWETAKLGVYSPFDKFCDSLLADFHRGDDIDSGAVRHALKMAGVKLVDDVEEELSAAIDAASSSMEKLNQILEAKHGDHSLLLARTELNRISEEYKEKTK